MPLEEETRGGEGHRRKEAARDGGFLKQTAVAPSIRSDSQNARSYGRLVYITSQSWAFGTPPSLSGTPYQPASPPADQGFDLLYGDLISVASDADGGRRLLFVEQKLFFANRRRFSAACVRGTDPVFTHARPFSCKTKHKIYPPLSSIAAALVVVVRTPVQASPQPA